MYKDPEKKKQADLKYKRSHREERSEYEREWRKKNPKSVRASKEKYNQEHPERLLLHSAKKRAKKLGREFTIVEKDIIIPESCPLLGIPLFKSKGRMADNSPSLDRIDSTKGYVPGNVWVISQRANMLKSNGTLEEFELIVKNLRKKLENS